MPYKSSIKSSIPFWVTCRLRDFSPWGWVLASEMRYRENRVEYRTQTWFDDSLPSLSPDICLLLQSKLMGRVVSGTLLPVNWKTARELPAGGRVAEGDGGVLWRDLWGSWLLQSFISGVSVPWRPGLWLWSLLSFNSSNWTSDGWYWLWVVSILQLELTGWAIQF